MADLRRAQANLDRSVGRNLSKAVSEPVVVPLDFAEDLSTLPPNNGVQQARATSGEPNILIISRDGSSLFSGDASDERIGLKLRRIADELDEMKTVTTQTAKQNTSSVSFGGAIASGWRQ